MDLRTAVLATTALELSTARDGWKNRAALLTAIDEVIGEGVIITLAENATYEVTRDLVVRLPPSGTLTIASIGPYAKLVLSENEGAMLFVQSTQHNSTTATMALRNLRLGFNP